MARTKQELKATEAAGAVESNMALDTKSQKWSDAISVVDWVNDENSQPGPPKELVSLRF